MSAALRQHERIKMELRLRGSSFAKIARALEVRPTTVTIVCRGWRRSRRIEAAIAACLGVPASHLWPDRYQGETRDELPSEVTRKRLQRRMPMDL